MQTGVELVPKSIEFLTVGTNGLLDTGAPPFGEPLINPTEIEEAITKMDNTTKIDVFLKDPSIIPSYNAY
jgi:hypothetical protein